jgi:hypothetical protein
LVQLAGLKLKRDPHEKLSDRLTVVPGLNVGTIVPKSLVADHKNLDHTFGAAFAAYAAFAAFAAVVKPENSALDLVAYLLVDHFSGF